MSENICEYCELKTEGERENLIIKINQLKSDNQNLQSKLDKANILIDELVQKYNDSEENRIDNLKSGHTYSYVLLENEMQQYKSRARQLK